MGRGPTLRLAASALAPLGRACHPPLRLTLFTLLLYVCLRPALAFGHQSSVAAIAWLSHALVATGFWQPMIGWLGVDPIYAGAAVRAVGGCEVSGLAVAGPPGQMLHQLLPSVFADPASLAAGASVSTVVVAGAPALGRGVAMLGADGVWLAIGCWLVWHWRRRNWSVVLLGLLIQGQIAINHLLDAHVRPGDIEASGLPFALAVAAPAVGWFTLGLARLPETLQRVLIGGLLLVLGYAVALCVLLVGWSIGRLMRLRRRPAPPRSSPRCASLRGVHPRSASLRGVHARSTTPQKVPLAFGIAAAIVAAVSPVGALAVGATNWQMGTAVVPSGRSLTPGAAGRQRALIYSPRTAGATPVSIEPRVGGGWRYIVNGQAEVIRGVGYNPWYASLSPADRATLYARDFSAMRQLGINTIEGWFEGQFDSITLDYAARNGIGVLMPFELNQDLNYADPGVQASILDRVSAYVLRYKDQPAVRMWAPGNENLHRVLYPHWTSQENDPTARARADAFAAFLPVLVDRIHELDPAHPVVYRDAEDLYLGRIATAMGSGRPWLVYGANVYALGRLQDVVGKWPVQWPGRPLLISEYAPGGVGPAERAAGYQQDWNVIRSRPDAVIGGLAYTWATNGPEDLDRIFGMVDPNGVATDGALAAISAAYYSDAVVADDSPPPN
ncbi:MAG: hypothetical protein JOZ81_22090 [Chloroflexi bacterium]|nr:hypothetical protein [Chloroflexota bacterium]